MTVALILACFPQSLWDLSGRLFLTQIARPHLYLLQNQLAAIPQLKLNLEAHELILKYLEGSTTLSATASFRPIAEGTDRDEKPILLRDYTS